MTSVDGEYRGSPYCEVHNSADHWSTEDCYAETAIEHMRLLLREARDLLVHVEHRDFRRRNYLCPGCELEDRIDQATRDSEGRSDG